MKNVLTSLVLTLATVLPVLAQSEADVQQVDGFRDFEWGVHLDSVSYDDGTAVGFNESERTNGGRYFQIPNDDYSIGSVLLREIHYVFSDEDDRFYKVVLVGDKVDTETMEFIVDHKYGDHVNESANDDKVIKQWIVGEVTFTLLENKFNTFELEIKSDWQAIEAYRKNVSVDDF